MHSSTNSAVALHVTNLCRVTRIDNQLLDLAVFLPCSCAPAIPHTLLPSLLRRRDCCFSGREFLLLQVTPSFVAAFTVAILLRK